MPWLDELGAYLQTQGLGTLASTLFLGVEPETPDTCVTLLDSPARGMAVRAMGPSLGLPSLERPRGQLRARGLDYVAARTLAASGLALLDWLGPVTLSGTRYLHVVALQRPAVLFDRDQNDRYIFGFNFEMAKAPS
jgi:hypothetical protein